MLQPKRTAHRKTHKISFEGKAKGNKYVAFGEMGLVSTTGA
jgi:large subunit ribosomal protein L16